jgi:putative acetyltransferase
MIIRSETPDDVEAIFLVTRAAFEEPKYSSHTEQFIVGALRAAGALTVSLVAEMDGRVVGHIAFSPVAVSDGAVGWFGLGPLSVVPELQRQGIGTALVRESLSLLRGKGAHGCVLVGSPDYYGRFGFTHRPGLTYAEAPAEVFLALPFGESVPEGSVTFHEGFAATE